jgi:TPR repeat protein
MWFERACEGGDQLGCVELGALYKYGEGVEQNLERARSLYEVACAAKLARGCLGRLWAIRGDFAKAVSLFRKACDSDTALGCSLWATTYELGAGVEADINQALRLHQRACDTHDAHGCTELARFHDEGKNLPRDAAQSVAFAKRAWDIDGRECMPLAVRYEQGRDVEPSLSKAATVLGTACRQHVAAASERLRRIVDESSLSAAEQQAAEAVLQPACELGHGSGCRDAGKN